MRFALFLVLTFLAACSASSQHSENDEPTGETLVENSALTTDSTLQSDTMALDTTPTESEAPDENNLMAQFIEDHFAANYADRELQEVLYISLVNQRMYHYKDGSIIRDFIISGAAKGAGNQSGSNQTPTGLHNICQKIGDDVPLGGILKSKVYTGKVATIYTDSTDVEDDHVTTRIMSLCGEEPGINKGGNVDSFNRYVYIHGTPEEGLLGQPASHGCIRMVNQEVIELYESVEEGTLVLILDE